MEMKVGFGKYGEMCVGSVWEKWEDDVVGPVGFFV